MTNESPASLRQNYITLIKKCETYRIPGIMLHESHANQLVQNIPVNAQRADWITKSYGKAENEDQTETMSHELHDNISTTCVTQLQRRDQHSAS